MTYISEAPEADVAFLEAVILVAEQLYGGHGTVPPFGVIQSLGQNGQLEGLIVMSEGLSTLDEKYAFIAAMQFKSLERAGIRTCLVYECWTVVAKTDEQKRRMAEIHARGGSLREHPDHGDGVTLQIESDAGTLREVLAIERPHPKIAKLIHHEPPVFIPRSMQNGTGGTLSGYHIPTSNRDDPSVKAFRSAMAKRPAFTIETAEDLLDGNTSEIPRPH